MSTSRHLGWQPYRVDGEGGAVGAAIGVDDIRRVLAEAELRSIPVDLDADDLGVAGWGVIVAAGVPAEIRRALEPLFSLRRQQAGDLFQELTYAGEERSRFLRNAGASRGRGPIDPGRLPYYLLLVGDPEQLPFELQFDLDLQRAVGRVHFDDPAAAARWVDSVIAAEGVAAGKGLSVFAPENEDDRLSALSVANLVRPLVTDFAERVAWPMEVALGAEATKSRLTSMLADNKGSLLFSAGHAVRFSPGHSRQRTEQGALVCADWPGPEKWQGAMPGTFLFGADDLSTESQLGGCIVFSYACYTVGTPHRDLFVRPAAGPSVLAPRPFLSRLSQAMLSHPSGAVPALVGYVDQTFESSFVWPTDDERVTTFGDTLVALTRGRRLGGALESFAERYEELATEIAEEIWRVPEAEMTDDQRRDLDRLWHAFQDARSFGVLGDPAVRLGFAGGD